MYGSLVLAGMVSEGAAATLAEKFPSLRNLFTATDAELVDAGIGARDRRKIAAVRDVVKAWGAERMAPGVRFRSGAEIFQQYHHRMRDLKVEQFWCILLDGKNRVKAEHMVSQGSLTASLVHPREVFAPAIRQSAGAIVFVHNHPSGDPTPSVEDVEITRRLCAVADLVGIRVLDHVVVGDGSYVSFLERGLLADKG